MRRLLAIGILGIAMGAATVAILLHRVNRPVDVAQTPLNQFESPDDRWAPIRAGSRPLAEIAALDDDFERNSALYALVANAGVADIEGILADVETLPPTPHRYDVARVLYIRFAGIDPAAAVDHVVAANYHSSWVAAVFRVWAHRDLDAAADRAATLSGDAKTIATGAILELDLPAWQRETLADHLVDSTMWETIAALGEISAREAARGGQQDFVSEAEAALLTTDAPAREWRVAQLFRRWVGVDPAAALAWVEDVTNRSSAQTTQEAFTAALVEEDPQMALDLLARTEGIWNHPNTLNILMSGLVKIGLEDAIRSLDIVPQRVQMSARSALLTAVRYHHAGEFESVLSWYGTLERPTRAHLASSLAWAFAGHDPEGALTWALDLEGDEAKRRAVSNVMYHLGSQDRAAGNPLLAQINDPEVRTVAMETFADSYSRADPQGGWRWARSSNLEKPHLLGRIFSRWVSRSPDDATRELLALPADLRDQTAAEISSYTIERLGPERAAQILDALESRDARRQVADGLVRYYTETYSDEDRAKFYRSIALEPVP